MQSQAMSTKSFVSRSRNFPGLSVSGACSCLLALRIDIYLKQQKRPEARAVAAEAGHPCLPSGQLV